MGDCGALLVKRLCGSWEVDMLPVPESLATLLCAFPILQKASSDRAEGGARQSFADKERP
jgi:hypothetical protein